MSRSLVFTVRRAVDLASIALFLAICLSTGDALAHHPAGPTDVGVRVASQSNGPHRWTTVGLSAQGGSSEESSYTSLVGSVDVHPSPWSTVGVRIPVHEVIPPGGGVTIGIGDIDFSGSLRLSTLEHLQPFAGLTFRIPTGDPDGGGGGAFRLVPHLGTHFRFDILRAHVALGDSIALDPDAAVDTHVEPTSSHELVYEALAGVEPIALLVAIRMGGVTVLASEGRGDTPLWLGPHVGWTATDRVRLGVDFDLPLTEPRRFDVRAGVRAEATF